MHTWLLTSHAEHLPKCMAVQHILAQPCTSTPAMRLGICRLDYSCWEAAVRPARPLLCSDLEGCDHKHWLLQHILWMAQCAAVQWAPNWVRTA